MSPITQTPIPLSDEWMTSDEIFRPLHSEFAFSLDAAAAAWNAKVGFYFTRETNGLAQSWKGETVWLNPPYSNVGEWLAKAYSERCQHGIVVVALVPCSPDRHWWSQHVEGKAEVRLLTRRVLKSGRVHFIREDGSTGRAPFASAVLIYGRKS